MAQMGIRDKMIICRLEMLNQFKYCINLSLSNLLSRISSQIITKQEIEFVKTIKLYNAHIKLFKACKIINDQNKHSSI